MVSEGLIINPVTKQFNENLSICVPSFWLAGHLFSSLEQHKITQKSRADMLNPYCYHAHVEGHLLCR